MKDSFIIYTKYEEQISLLSDAQAGVLFRALFCYQTEKTLPQMDSMTNIVFTVIRQQIDFDNQKYLDICEARRVAGSQGGRPSKSLGNKGNKPKKANGFENEEEKANGFSEKQTKAKKAESDPDTDPDNDTESDIIERKKEIEEEGEGRTCASTCENHEEIMREYGMTDGVIEALKNFLRHCYLNGNIVSNAKLEDILFRLVERFGTNSGCMIDCINKAICGGYLDIKA